jgi:hypothetical protein
MVSVLVASVVGCGFEPRSGQAKNYNYSIKENEQRMIGLESG